MKINQNMAIGKNVSLTAQTLEIIIQYMNKTQTNFSATLVQIIKEWDEFSIELERYKRKQIEAKAEQEIKDIKSAKMVKT